MDDLGEALLYQLHKSRDNPGVVFGIITGIVTELVDVNEQHLGYLEESLVENYYELMEPYKHALFFEITGLDPQMMQRGKKTSELD